MRRAKDRPIELQLWLHVMDMTNWVYRKTRSERAWNVYIWSVGKAAECWVADDVPTAGSTDELGAFGEQEPW